MQQALVALGYLKGASDGNFGTGTKTAVENFQKDNGLDVDGIAGAKTLEKLYTISGVTRFRTLPPRRATFWICRAEQKLPSFKERLCSDADRTLYRIYSAAWFKGLLRKRL